MAKSLLNCLIISLLFSCGVFAQEKDTVFLLSSEQINENGWLILPPVTQWKFKKGHDPKWADPNLNEVGWAQMDSLEIASFDYDENNRFEGWFRFRIRFEPNKEVPTPFLRSINGAAQDIYLNGDLVASFGNTGSQSGSYRVNKGNFKYLPLQPGKEYLMAVHFKDWVGALSRSVQPITVMGSSSFLFMASNSKRISDEDLRDKYGRRDLILFTILTLITLLFWLIFALNPREKYLLFISLLMTFLALSQLTSVLRPLKSDYIFLHAEWVAFRNIIGAFAGGGMVFTFPLVIATIYLPAIPKWLKWQSFAVLGIFLPIFVFFAQTSGIIAKGIPTLVTVAAILASLFILLKSWKSIKGVKWIITTGILLIAIVSLIQGILYISGTEISINQRVLFYYGSALVIPITLLIYVAFWIKESRLAERAKAEEVIRITSEKQELLAEQNIVLEEQVAKRTTELQNSLQNLKATQSQLVHAEKMASLGELTAGIAHEIKNPLNFVNNFSEVSRELLEEMKEELKKGDTEEADAIASDVITNLEKIVHHGQRADSIVRSMLQHSRSGDGKKEPTDLNALADEYLRLAYHGLRAKDKSFNADMETHYDPNLPEISVVPQDIGRVILNLLTNAFYAVNQKKKETGDAFKPVVDLRTQKTGKGVEIQISDNGNGMPNNVRDKIFQPFFTTKPTGEGTGLGLSMSYDIVKKGHSGDIQVHSEEGKGTTFRLILPENPA